MKVLIIGGGPAGMLAAISAAKNRKRSNYIRENELFRKKTTYYRKR